TGTSSGFGRRLVEIALARGDRVLASARDPSKLTFPSNPSLRTLALDLNAGFAAIQAAVDGAVAACGWDTVDVLVNNGGIGLPGYLEEGGSARLMQQFQTNVFGPLDVTNAVLPYMRKRDGTVVMIGSRSAWRPEIRVRAPLHALTECLTVEIAPFGIRTLLVEPGAFRTENIYGQHFLSPSTHPADFSTGGTARDIPDYAVTRDADIAKFAAPSGKQPGDPDKAARAIVDVVRGEGVAEGREWPMYLVLGTDADDNIREKVGKVIKDIDEWRDVVRGVGFEPDPKGQAPVANGHAVAAPSKGEEEDREEKKKRKSGCIIA
ncbi:NAD(P)-binding protein, partial [Coniophora puteana RWD-64-598 SS2]